MHKLDMNWNSYSSMNELPIHQCQWPSGIMNSSYLGYGGLLTKRGGGGGLVTKSCPTLGTTWTVARQAPLSMGFSRHED